MASLIISLSPANAASDFDGLLHVTPTLEVYTDGAAKTQTMDISDTWWRDFKQSYEKRVAQNIGFPANFTTEFEDIVSHGGSWGIYTQEDSNGILLNIVATRDPYAHCGFSGLASSGTYECISNAAYGYVSASYFTHNSFGNNGCYGSYGNRCSDNGTNIYTSPTLQSAGTGDYTIVSIPNVSPSIYQFFAMDFDLSYPSGYLGDRIPAGVPPVPLVTTYYGTVDCGNDSLGYMLITQDGNTNAVPLTHESIYRASWTYELSDNPYVITVGCGNFVAASFGSNTPMPTSSNDWMCDTTGNLKYCIVV